MAKAWIVDRWLKDAVSVDNDGNTTRISATSTMKRKLTAKTDPLSLSENDLPREYRTTVFGKGLRWRVNWYENSDGRKKLRSKSFQKYADAEEYKTALDDDVRSGRYQNNENRQRTFQEASDAYLRGKHNLKGSSLYRYNRDLKKYVLPRWGAVPLSTITKEDIDIWVTKLQSGISPVDIDRTKHQGLSPSSIHGIVAVAFGSVLRYAAKREWLRKNPLDDVELPRAIDNTADGDDMVFLTYSEVEALAAVTDEKSDATLIRFLAYCGPRIGEAAALRVEQVDFEKRRVRISRTLTVDANGKPKTGTPKTGKSRTIAFPEFLADDLSELTRGHNDEDFLFRTKQGTQLNVSNWRNRVFRKAVEGAGLGDIQGLKVHSLRHTYASLAIASGADVKTVQRQLGHEDAAMTLNTYAGLWPDRLDEVADTMQQKRSVALRNPTSLSHHV
ncbi:MAG: site-specific integrase [Bifidobacteriaceae bacterium]|jgi:integrase|nr:site-specific integrase [Bifidobacteriaceae bacterium]MCI1978168.1 site-specific integrase [Bifidobacteriaceae bacterium]